MSSVYEGSGRWSNSSSVWATPFASPFPSLNRSLNRSSLRARAGVRPPMPAAVARARAASAGRPSASASPPPPPRSSPLPPAAHDAAGQAWDRGLRLPSVTRPPSSPVGTLNPSSSNPPSPARPPSLKRAVKLAVAKGPTWSLDVRRAPTAPSIRPPPLSLPLTLRLRSRRNSRSPPPRSTRPSQRATLAALTATRPSR